MKEIILPAVIEKTATSAPDKYQKRLRRWKLTLYCSTVAGVFAALAGLFLGAISYAGFFKDADAFNLTGNLLVIAAFPLMMVGAHALDKINEIKFRKMET